MSLTPIFGQDVFDRFKVIVKFLKLTKILLLFNIVDPKPNSNKSANMHISN